MTLLQVGSAAPAFKGMNLLGGEFSLDSVKGTRGVVISFSPDQINPAQVSWAKNLYEKNKTEVELVSIVRKIPSVTMAKAFLQQLGLKSPAVYDQKQEIFQLYGVENPVVIYSINKDGVITNVAQIEPKAFNQAAMQEAIDKAK
ncbi:MAG: redoxin domain-containing protein [Chloroflexota bacterium]|nr:MAG: redoxin domain-containing protein [Chloroflexota bacterium]